MEPKLSPNMENYLEAIYLLELDQTTVRIKDIAEKMAITMPSVSNAVKNLEKAGLVFHPRYDLVGLTPKGTVAARKLYRKHRVIKEFLSEILGLDNEIAEKDACCIEHIISPETFEKLAAFMESVNGKGLTHE